MDNRPFSSMCPLPVSAGNPYPAQVQLLPDALSMVIDMTFRNVNFPSGDLMRVPRGVQAVRNPKSIIRAWRRSWLCRLLIQKGEP